MPNRTIDDEVEDVSVLWHAGNHELALTRLDEIIANNNDSIGLWSTRGMWLAQLNRHEEALAAFRRSTAIESTYPDHYNAGNQLLALGRLEEAIIEFDASIRCEDSHPESWVNRGIALNRLDQPEPANASFEQALTIDSDFIPGLRCKAMVQRTLGNPSEVESLYARIAALCPNAPGAALDLARALGQLPSDGHMELHPEGREWRALEAINRAIELCPENPEPLALKAIVLGHLMHANVSFRIMRPREGGGLDQELVAGPLDTGEFCQELVVVCESALKFFPDDTWFTRKLATAHEFSGNIDHAIALFRQVCELAPDKAKGHVDLAFALLEFGDKPAAKQSVHRAIELDSSLDIELSQFD